MHGFYNYFMFDMINKDGNAYVVDCQRFYLQNSLLTSGSFPNGEWTDYSFVMDVTPGAYRLKSMSVNGITNDFNVPTGNSSGNGSIGNSLYFGGWGNPDIYMDDLKLTIHITVTLAR